MLQIARLYDRMGCDVLALDLGNPLGAVEEVLCPADLRCLVRNWEFLKQVPAAEKAMNQVPNPRLLLRRRSSLVVADMSIPTSPSAVKSTGLKSPPPPKVFEEPEANSLLDAFGF